jgi:hypothetical protein
VGASNSRPSEKISKRSSPKFSPISRRNVGRLSKVNPRRSISINFARPSGEIAVEEANEAENAVVIARIRTPQKLNVTPYGIVVGSTLLTMCRFG